MTPTHQFADARRRSDGSIDFDYYRARAVALRGQAVRDTARLNSTFRFTLAGIAAIAAATVILSAPAPRPQNDLSHIAGTWSSGAGPFGQTHDAAKRQAAMPTKPVN